MVGRRSKNGAERETVKYLKEIEREWVDCGKLYPSECGGDIFLVSCRVFSQLSKAGFASHGQQTTSHQKPECRRTQNLSSRATGFLLRFVLLTVVFKRCTAIHTEEITMIYNRMEQDIFVVTSVFKICIEELIKGKIRVYMRNY